MKTLRFLSLLAVTFALASHGQAGDPPALKVGIYDSRVVAYAHSGSSTARAALDRLIAEARSAEAAGDREKSTARKKEIAALQRQRHLQVFSTAPATEALAALGPRLPALQTELGVERLVSKWDHAALSALPMAQKLDATDRLVAEFGTPDEKQRRTIERLKAAKPLPLWQAKLMVALGNL